MIAAQEIDIGSETEKPVEERILYSHQNTISATLHTQGVGVGFQIGRIRSIYRTTEWDFGFSTLRPLKQIKSINVYQFNAQPYVYGKLNDVFAFRAGFANQNRIFGKPYWGGVELRWLYEGGLSLAIQKPYYYSVVVAKPTGSGTYEQVNDVQTFESSDTWIEIIGRAPFKTGINELSFVPGIHAKGGLNFDFGTSKSTAQCIETGIMAEVFPTGLSLMADNPKDRFIMTFYLSYRWGSKFNKY